MTRHGVTIDVVLDQDHEPAFQPRCQTVRGQEPGCGWKGRATADHHAADREADDHAERWEIEYALTPFPGAPKAKLPARAETLLLLLTEQPQVLCQPDGVSAVGLAHRGLAVKEGRKGWRTTRRGRVLQARLRRSL